MYDITQGMMLLTKVLVSLLVILKMVSIRNQMQMVMVFQIGLIRSQVRMIMLKRVKIQLQMLT